MTTYRTHARTPSEAAALASLSGLLEGPPSSTTWDALLRFFNKRGGAATEEELAHAEAQLSHWPDELRVLPVEADSADEALAQPVARLARNFDLCEGDSAGAVEALVRRMPREARHLRFGCSCFNIAAALRRLDALPHLVSLDLDYVEESTANVPELVEALSAVELPSLRRLGLAVGTDDPVTAQLAEIPAWPRLRALSLQVPYVEAGAIDALFGRSRCPPLEELVLGLPPEVPVSTALVASPALRSLRAIEGVTLDRTMAGWLTTLTGLLRLSLSLGPEGAAPLRTLADHPLPAVEKLRLSGPLGDPGLELVVRAFPALADLFAHDCGVGARGAAALGASGRALGSLTLSFNALGDEGARALSPALVGVRELNLHQDAIGEVGLRALAPALGSVERLDLRDNPIGPAGARLLATTPMPALATLWLGGCGIQVAGARSLAASPNLRRIENLGLDLRGPDAALVPEGVRALVTSEHASPSLREDLSRWIPPEPGGAGGFFRRLLGRR